MPRDFSVTDIEFHQAMMRTVDEKSTMVIQLLSAFSVLALVIAGLLILVRAVNVEQVSDAFARFLILAASLIVTLCALKTLWCLVLLPGLLSILAFLKQALFIIAVAIIVTLVAFVLIHRRITEGIRDSSTRGEL